MKKILTILAATATMFAFGAGNLDTTISHGADFEAFTAGNAFSAGLNDSAQPSAPFYWYTADADAANIISNYTGSGTDVPIASRPEKFADDVNSKYLQVETTGKLYRTVKNNGGSDDFTTNVTATYAHSLADAPIYLDTLVKFTAADSVFGDDALENGDKIAIEYVEHESEGPGDDTVTNFVVRAGYVTGSGNGATVVQTNYFVAPPSNFDKDAWHRLTVRTISDVGDGTIGFVIYLDQALLKYSADVAAGDAAFVGGLNNDVSSKFYNDEDAAVGHALFPSVVRTGAAKTTISAAAFSGNGSLDDVVFTTTKPEFIQETALVTVRWDTNKITAVTLNSTGLTQAQWEVGEIAIPPVNDSVVFSVTLAADCVMGTSTVSDGYGNWDGYTTFENLKAGAICNIVALKPICQVNNTYYENLDEAIAAAQEGTAQSPATLKLLADCDKALSFTTGYIVLDLAGHDLQATSAEDIFTIANMGANLVITNSGAEASVKLPTGPDAAGLMYLSELGGFTTIQAGTFEGYIYCYINETEKEPADMLRLTGGKFLDQMYDESDPQPFYLASCVAAGLKTTYRGSNYFEVGEGGEGPQVTTYELTIPVVKVDDVTAATATVTAGGVAVADLTAIPSGTVVTVTWTAEEGYKITAGETEEITMSENKTAAVPTVAAITYATLTITQVANCTIVVSNATAEVASGTKFDVADTVQLTVYRAPADGYVLDNCAATETITMDQDQTVTAAVKVSGGYPTYIENITDPATKAAYEAKYDIWKATYGADTESAYQDAFLLNCSTDAAVVAAEKAAFKFTSISYDTTESKWVTTTTTQNTNGANYNGTVVVTRYSDVGCTTASETGNFFKAELK